VRAGGSNPSAMTPSRVVAVEGILVAWKAALFAGRRRNGGLGRSVVPQRVSSRGGGRADDSGCPKGAEEGNVVAHALQSVCTGARTRDRRLRSADASFARSFDPCASILTTHGGAKSVDVVGRPLRHHGWANPREREEPTLGSDGRTQCGSPRATAPARERAWRVREGRRSRPSSLRGSRVPVGCSHVVFSCRSLQATSGLE